MRGIKNYLFFKPDTAAEEFVLNDKPPAQPSSQVNAEGVVGAKHADNLQFIKTVFTYPLNFPVNIREFEVRRDDKVYQAFIVFVDGMVDRRIVDDSVLKPLIIVSQIKTQ